MRACACLSSDGVHEEGEKKIGREQVEIVGVRSLNRWQRQVSAVVRLETSVSADKTEIKDDE